MSEAEPKPSNNGGHSLLPPPSKRLLSELKSQQTLRFCYNTYRAPASRFDTPPSPSPIPAVSTPESLGDLSIEFRDPGTRPHWTGNGF